jgi:iron complex transport system permease protein
MRVGSRSAVFLPLLAGLLAAVLVINLMVGAAAISFSEVAAILAGGAGADPANAAIINQIRAPRILLALAVGAALGAAGAAMQGLFRNPLADPGLLGVSAGAALGAAAWIALLGGATGLLAAAPDWVHAWGTSGAAFVGALLASIAVWLVARAAPDGGIAFMLLAGVAVQAVAGAVLGLLIYLADEAETRSFTFWMLGSLAGGTWSAVIPALIAAGLAVAGLMALARPLDLMSLGEAEAAAAGVDVDPVRWQVALAVALGAGAVTAVAGLVGFVGLIAPHLARALVGPRHRLMLPASALCGALLVAAADIPARTLVVPSELPIGVVTSLIGAPLFAVLMWRAARSLAL